MSRLIVCLICGQTRPNKARQLCGACHGREHRHGTLSRWPEAMSETELHRLHTGPRADRVAAYLQARRWGLTQAQAARRLELTPGTARSYETEGRAA